MHKINYWPFALEQGRPTGSVHERAASPALVLGSELGFRRCVLENREGPAVRRNLRAILLFALGTAGITYETLLAHPPNVALITAFVSMMGLPVALRKDDDGDGDGATKKDKKPRPGIHIDIGR